MLKTNSVALASQLDRDLRAHLIRPDGQEDLCFALWYPSEGTHRVSALISVAVFPLSGERNVHGNASFEPAFLHRALEEALRCGAGLAFLHSHPFPGWQRMSDDDIAAETRLARAACALTGLPLIGLTTGSDGTWSARSWAADPAALSPQANWSPDVRIVGEALVVFNNPRRQNVVQRGEGLVRTVAAWGDVAQRRLEQIRIGIVGLGSVGSLVVEALARMGMRRLTLIDYDRVELINLDRLVSATSRDVGRLKVDVVADRVHAVSTALDVEVNPVPHGVADQEGYRAALDCDVLFSCVDRPHPRHVLNFFAYSHLIPVIDGGVLVRHRSGQFCGADWQLQTVGPTRACLQCLGAYNADAVSLDQAGLLDDPSYMVGLASDSPLGGRENVFPFSANLASLEVFHLVALVTGIAGLRDMGVQRFRYYPGTLDQRLGETCRPSCEFPNLIATGDHHFSLIQLAQARAADGSTSQLMPLLEGNQK